MKDSIVIVAFFIVGVMCGFGNFIPHFVSGNSDISFYALCALMFFVGMSVGCDSKIFSSIRSVNPRLMLLPLLTILGTWAGVTVVSFFFPRHSLSDFLAVGSGFGYYSLSSIFITEYRGAELGTIALLANIVRELIVLLCAPLLVKFFWKTCSYFSRRSNDNGYYIACHTAQFWSAVYNAVSFSWFHC